MVEKRFPATTSTDFLTFLNDKKVDGELYAIFQELSYPDKQKRTIVDKKKLPSQAVIASKLGIKSPKTIRSHRDYLINQGYIIEEGDKYILPNKEEIFFMIPLNTLQFINDTLKEQVIKVYVYLGQRWKYKQGQPVYVFTECEIAEHIGIKLDGNPRGYATIRNALICLKKLGLIDYVEFYEKDEDTGKPVPRKRLTKFTFEIDGR